MLLLARVTFCSTRSITTSTSNTKIFPKNLHKFPPRSTSHKLRTVPIEIPNLLQAKSTSLKPSSSLHRQSNRCLFSSSSSSSPTPKPSLTSKLKAELLHYARGSKLLALEVRISSKLLWKLARGQSLIRREQEQLKRTIADLFRLVPFSVFVIVPFMEFALPVFLKLFPNMLPSTFGHASKEEAKRIKQIKLKIQMATFLKDTIKAMNKQIDASPAITALFEAYERSKSLPLGGPNQQSSDSSSCDFFNAIPPSELEALQHQYGDFFTWQALSSPALKSICKYLGLYSWGPSSLLISRITRRLSWLYADDLLIWREGGPSQLTESELRTACHERGISHSNDVPLSQLQHQLEQWIELHCQKRISPALLVLSRAFSLHLLGAVARSEERELPLENSTSSSSQIPASIEARLAMQQRQEQLIAQELEAEVPMVEAQASSSSNDNSANSPGESEKSKLEGLREELAALPIKHADKSTKVLASEVENLVHQADRELGELEELQHRQERASNAHDDKQQQREEKVTIESNSQGNQNKDQL